MNREQQTLLNRLREEVAAIRRRQISDVLTTGLRHAKLQPSDGKFKVRNPDNTFRQATFKIALTQIPRGVIQVFKIKKQWYPIPRIFIGTTAEEIAPGNSGDVTTSLGLFGEDNGIVQCHLLAAHFNDPIQTGKSVIYYSEGNDRLIIGADCNTVVTPPPPTPPTLQDFLPTDASLSVSTTPTLTWTSNGDTFEVWFGVPGNLFPYTVGVTSFTPPGTLASGQQYNWQVRAKTTAGGQTNGPILLFTTA